MKIIIFILLIDCMIPLPHYGLPRRFARLVIIVITPRKDGIINISCNDYTPSLRGVVMLMAHGAKRRGNPQ